MSIPIGILTIINNNNKMIAILSSSSDANIDFVLSWLREYNYEYIRINSDEIIESEFQFDLFNSKIIYNGQELAIDKINVVWYRKFGDFSKSSYFEKIKDQVGFHDQQQLAKEYNSILGAIISLFKGKKWITPPWQASVNKIDILSLAIEHEINVPKTWIISNKEKLQMLKGDMEFISKSIFEPYFIHVREGYYSMFTKTIKISDSLPKSFFPSLVQEKIYKKYEIRSFYLFGKFYSMAIFSQSDKKSSEDFRKYDYTRPNRRVPYQLPTEIENKIESMLKIMELNCCSIDLIRSTNNKYYFLEINPTGEFGMVSIPCNYEIYRDIANKLIELDYD